MTEKERLERIEAAKKELNIIRAMPKHIQDMFPAAVFKSLQAVIDGQRPRVLNWTELATKMFLMRPKTVVIGMKEDWNATRRACYCNGVLHSPFTSASSWDEPMIKFDDLPPMPCWLYVDDIGSITSHGWPSDIVKQLHNAKMVKGTG